MQNAEDSDSDSEVDLSEALAVQPAGAEEVVTSSLASADTREKARALLAKHIDAPEALKRRLVRRLDEEIVECAPEGNEYRQCARGLAANFRRNTMLAAGYAGGRVPPQWLTLAHYEALAPRLQQLRRRCFRAESLKEARHTEESADLHEKAWR